MVEADEGGDDKDEMVYGGVGEGVEEVEEEFC